MNATAISQFVIKVHSRCDLACNHCYIYEHEDQSWRERPRAMHPDTVARTAERIAEHAADLALPQVHIVLHGGEPLLLGPHRMGTILSALRTRIDPVTRLDLRVLTNAVRLSPEFCEVFDRFDVRVGVSLDGDRAANDRHRLFADGRSSHAEVMRGLKLLRRPEYRHLYAGILCTIDTANDPEAVYDALMAEEPPRLDFLLPLATWEHPPQRHTGSPTEYADWLLAIHERWHRHGRPVPVRLLDSLEGTFRGEPSRIESIGTDPVNLIVIETDGAYEQADSLKTAYHGAPATGFHVTRHSISEAAAYQGIRARQSGVEGLCDTCRACPVVQHCGGGLYAHRYRPGGSGFNNPSVYCADLLALITALRGRSVPRANDAGETEEMTGPDPAALTAEVDAESTIRLLFQLELGLNRSLVHSLVDEASPLPSATRGAWEILTELDEAAPRVIERTLGHPFVRVWASRELSAERAALDLSWLNAMALSTAANAERHVENLALTPYDGQIHIPGLGTLHVPGTERAVAAAAPGSLHITADATSYEIKLFSDRPATPEAWHPIRSLTAAGITVDVEDAHPYRDCYEFSVAPALSDEDHASLQRTFADAISFLDESLPHYASGLRAGLRCVVLLEQDGQGRSRSATTRLAFGSVAFAPVRDAATLALLLVHEFQHTKLHALLDFVTLYGNDGRDFFVPWREVRLPVDEALQEAYARVAVAQYWHAIALADTGAGALKARTTWRQLRNGTLAVFDALLLSGCLTDAGIRFVEGQRGALIEI